MSELQNQPMRRVAWKDLWITIGLIAVVAASLAILAAATGWEETLASVLRLEMLQIIFLLILSLANYALRAIRWHMFCKETGLPLSILQSVRHYLGGFAMTVTPGRVGELIRLRWVRQETGVPFERTAPIMLVDRASDLASIGILIGLALAMSTTGTRGGIPVAVVSLLVALIVTRETLFRFAVDTAWRAIGRWPRLFARLRRAAKTLGPFSKWHVALPTLGLGILGWFAEGYAFHLLLVWMGADIGVWAAIAIFMISMVTGGATGSPGGLGGAEAAMVALLTVEGVPLDISIPATAVIRLTTLWFALLVGVLVFPIASRAAMKGQYAVKT